MVADLRGSQVEVSPGAGDQHACRARDVQASHAVDAGLGKAVVACAIGTALSGGGDVDVTPGRQEGGALGLDLPADVIDVLLGQQRHGCATDVAAHVLDVFGVDLHQVAPGDGAAVGGVCAQVELHVTSGQQGACAYSLVVAMRTVLVLHLLLISCAVSPHWARIRGACVVGGEGDVLCNIPTPRILHASFHPEVNEQVHRTVL